jgi:hypothetical protein
MMKFRVLEALFFANAIVLLAHQIDAAFWHEWILFGLPGGIQFFLLLNLPIIALVLYGQRSLALGRPSGKAVSWALAASGLFAAVFHGFHLLRGDEAFRLPFSMTLLVATFVFSLAQALVLMLLKDGEAGDQKKGEI